MVNSLLIKIIVGVVLVGGGFSYYWYTQAKIEELSNNYEKIKAAYNQSEEVISQLEYFNKKQNEDITLLENSLKETEEYADRLRSVLQKHNLTNLAYQKPEMIEKRINDASNEVLDSIAADTRN